MFIPQSTSQDLNRRYSCPSGYYVDGYGNCNRSDFYYWGRWVLAGVVIFFFIALFITWSCISNRRRRRMGMQPRYGTGWMTAPFAGGYGGHGGQQQPAPQYGNNNNNNGGWFGSNKYNNPNPPPPQYTPNAVPNQYTGNTFNSNEGYYGQQPNDVPLQQPAGSYYPPRGVDTVYEPPTSPPPAKH